AAGPDMAANMYRVGDYVYFENSSSNPYLIRRIEELNKPCQSAIRPDRGRTTARKGK
ncbi:MTA1 isoform 6, partial [Pan troglodytes]